MRLTAICFKCIAQRLAILLSDTNRVGVAVGKEKQQASKWVAWRWLLLLPHCHTATWRDTCWQTARSSNTRQQLLTFIHFRFVQQTLKCVYLCGDLQEAPSRSACISACCLDMCRICYLKSVVRLFLLLLFFLLHITIMLHTWRKAVDACWLGRGCTDLIMDWAYK